MVSEAKHLRDPDMFPVVQGFLGAERMMEPEETCTYQTRLDLTSGRKLRFYNKRNFISEC